VNRMHNDRDTGARGRHAPKDSGFAAVGVDNIGALSAKNRFEAAPRQVVIQRVDRSDERRFEPQHARRREKERLQRAFRPQGGARNQIDLEARFFAQTKNRRNGIFLRAADD